MDATVTKTRDRGSKAAKGKAAPYVAPRGVSVDSVLFTDELYERESRGPDHDAERGALLSLTQHLADSPRTILKRLTEVALDVCRAGSSGVSLLSDETGDFYWPAVTGVWEPHTGGGTPRDFGPCGVVLDSGSVQLFKHPELYFPYLGSVSPAIEEALLTPFYVGGIAVGTVWVVAHDEGRQFDGEDLRMIESLGRFAAAAFTVLKALDDKEHNEGKVREISDAYVKAAARHLVSKAKSQKAQRDREMLKKLVRAQEVERKRLSRDLHDELGQQLTVMSLKLNAFKNGCSDAVTVKLIDELELITKELDRGVDFLAQELRPAALDDFGLAAALRHYVKQWSSHVGLNARLRASGMKETRFSPEVETNLYRIVQESLNNISKHASAANAEISITNRKGVISLLISDDGKGFRPKKGKPLRQCLGLTGMNERAALIGGSVDIESAPGEGTTIYVRVPARVSNPESLQPFVES